MTELYTLYGAQISNYTAKVRSYLIFKKLLFQEVVATNYIYDKILVPVVGFRMMPVICMPDGLLLQDSTDIIDALEARFPDPPIYPSSPSQHLAALLLEAYAHDWVRILAMYYRWGFPQHNRDYLNREFGRMYEPTASSEDQIKIGEKSSAWARERLPSLGVTKRTMAQYQASTLALLAWLDDHFAQYPFLLGARPCIADFAFMGPLYGHFYRDPYSFSVMCSSPNVVRWVERMNMAPVSEGSYLSNDKVPASLLPILRQAFKEYVPVALDTIQRVSRWVASNPQAAIPRLLGTQRFQIGDASETRRVWTCIQYMMQRPLFLYQSATAERKTAMDSLLRAIDKSCDLTFAVTRPVKRENFKLVAAR